MGNGILKSVVAIAMAGMATLADAQVWVGYCEDSDIMTSSLSSSNIDATISVASAITPSMFDGMPQSVVRSVEVGLSQVNGLSSLTIWLSNHLGGERMMQIEADVTTLSTGWNVFDLPAEIDPAQMGDTLYLGIDYTQNVKSVKAMGSSGKKGTANSYWAASNGKWQDRSSSYKPACLMLGAYRTEGHDLRLNDAWIVENRYQELGDAAKPVKVHGIMQNAGSDVLHEYEIRLTSATESGSAVNLVQQMECDLVYMQKGEFEIEFVPDMSQLHSNIALTIELLRTDDLDEEDASDNQLMLYYDVVASTDEVISVQDAGLMAEQFVSLGNGWSVLGQQQVREAIGQYSATNGAVPVVMLTNHRGYGPADSLTVSDKGDYTPRTVFGEEGLSYAPALSIDRTKVLSSTLPVCDLAEALGEAADKKVPHTAIRDVRLTCNASECEVKAVVDVASYNWCANPVLMAALVRNDVKIAAGSQKRYDAEAGENCPEEHCVLVKYLTSGTGISLIDGSGNAIAAIASINEGRIPSPQTGEVERSFGFTLPADADETHPKYAVVLWVCNMTDNDRTVDCVKMIREF